MYTPKTATREFALKAAAAAERALNRSACSKSQFKFKCFSCGEFINRGDNITRCMKATTGMKLRYRGADANSGLTMDETVFYQGENGKDMWVHVGCIPCFWDKGLDEDGKRLTYPRLRPICTEWGVKVYGEYEEWCGIQGCDEEVLPHFRLMKGYPEEKFMRDRIINALKRFQALWRGYRYRCKKACTEALPFDATPPHLDARSTMSSTQEKHDIFHPSRDAEFWEQWKKSAAATRFSLQCWQEVPDLTTKRHQESDVYGNLFYNENKKRQGSNTAILFDRGRKNEAIYSCKIEKISGEHDAVHVYVRFHHDQEWKKYHWRKFQHLERECHDFMTKLDIILDAFEGKISTHHRHRWHNENAN